jgi:hypothetical protein
MVGFIGTSLQLQLIITAHTLNDVCLTNLYEESLTNLGLIFTTWIHESTTFYKFYAARIEVTASKGSITARYECVPSATTS